MSEETSQARLASLAEFQEAVITHAMTFPKVKRIVYSTCSVHFEENEEVVANILRKQDGWKLDMALPQWPRRGIVREGGLSETEAEMVVRTDPNHDETNGFFVACFIKK